MTNIVQNPEFKAGINNIRNIHKGDIARGIGALYKLFLNFSGKRSLSQHEDFDLVIPELHIYVRFCDRISTLSEEQLVSLTIQMQSKILDDPKATCYLVELLMANNTEMALAAFKNKNTNNKIRLISIDRFFQMMFNDSETFTTATSLIPSLISQHTHGKAGEEIL